MPDGGSEPPGEFTALLDGARRYERSAFDELFNMWSGSLHTFALARGVNEPEDVVNETFMGIFKSIHRFTGTESDFRAWVFRIARNKITDHHRRRGRSPVTFPLETAPAIVGGNVEEEAMEEFGNERLVELLDLLTDAQREMIMLRIVGDLTIDQVASVMGRSSGAVKLLQNRALQQLERALLDQRLATEDHPGDCVV